MIYTVPKFTWIINSYRYHSHACQEFIHAPSFLSLSNTLAMFFSWTKCFISLFSQCFRSPSRIKVSKIQSFGLTNSCALCITKQLRVDELFDQVGWFGVSNISLSIGFMIRMCFGKIKVKLCSVATETYYIWQSLSLSPSLAHSSYWRAFSSCCHSPLSTPQILAGSDTSTISAGC